MWPEKGLDEGPIAGDSLDFGPGWNHLLEDEDGRSGLFASGVVDDDRGSEYAGRAACEDRDVGAGRLRRVLPGTDPPGGAAGRHDPPRQLVGSRRLGPGGWAQEGVRLRNG